MEKREGFNKEPQPTVLATTSQEWEICDIIGHKMISDKTYYYLGWDRSWVPESEMSGAKKLVDVYYTKLCHAQGRSEDGPESRGQKRSRLVIGGPEAKKRRGWPRKQKRGNNAKGL